MKIWISTYLLMPFFFVANGQAASTVYLNEGFNGGSFPAGWSQVRISGMTAAWSVVGQGSNPTIPPYAGQGQAKFNSFDAPAGEQARLVSPAINLPPTGDPFLIFFMYHEDEYLSSFDSVYVEASAADSVTGPWIRLSGIRRPTSENRWSKETVSLYPMRGTNRLFLSLRGVSKFGNNIYVDEFRVADSTFHDIGATSLIYPNQPQSATQQMSPGVQTSSRIANQKADRVDSSIPEPVQFAASGPVILNAITRNFGTFQENSYSISWRVDAQLQSAVAGHPLAARTGRDTVTLSWQAPTAGVHTITAWTVLPSDSNRNNDTTRLLIQVLDSSTVFYESFNGTIFPPTNWAVINRDGGALLPWFRGADTSAFVPFDGSGFAANNFQRTNGAYLDDYLITPPIAEVGQTSRTDSLIFWVRSKFNSAPSQNFPDSLMVMLSTSGIDTSNFTVTLEYFSVPKTGWTRKAYLLSGRVPANSTIRIAFRYLLFNSGFGGANGDFVGIDAVQVVRKLPTSVEYDIHRPDQFSLEQNYPNPFNPTTTIQFSVGTHGRTSLRVYDLLGREVATLVDEVRSPGEYIVKWEAEKFSSGIYFYNLTAGSFSQTRKLVLLR